MYPNEESTDKAARDLSAQLRQQIEADGLDSITLNQATRFEELKAEIKAIEPELAAQIGTFLEEKYGEVGTQIRHWLAALTPALDRQSKAIDEYGRLLGQGAPAKGLGSVASSDIVEGLATAVDRH